MLSCFIEFFTPAAPFLQLDTSDECSTFSCWCSADVLDLFHVFRVLVRLSHLTFTG